MGLFFSIWRRFFGGYEDEYKDGLEYRGVQMFLCVFVVFLYEWLAKGYLWYISLLTGVLVYVFWCKGHFYYFQCGTESDIYIDQQEKKGRKPAMDWLVAPVNKWLKFKPRSKQYCFIGMLIRYTVWAIPVAVIVGWQFMIAGLSVAFIYNACFWVDFPPCKFAKSPTNWAEMISGFVIGLALL